MPESFILRTNTGDLITAAFDVFIATKIERKTVASFMAHIGHVMLELELDELIMEFPKKHSKAFHVKLVGFVSSEEHGQQAIRVVKAAIRAVGPEKK